MLNPNVRTLSKDSGQLSSQPLREIYKQVLGIAFRHRHTTKRFGRKNAEEPSGDHSSAFGSNSSIHAIYLNTADLPMNHDFAIAFEAMLTSVAKEAASEAKKSPKSITGKSAIAISTQRSRNSERSKAYPSRVAKNVP